MRLGGGPTPGVLGSEQRPAELAGPAARGGPEGGVARPG